MNLAPAASGWAKQLRRYYFSNMAKLVGYMLTWTTYGSWLQGDKRGFVRNGEIPQGDEKILELCKKFQKCPTVKLTNQEKVIIETAILKEAERISHKIEALAVCTNHIHLAARPCDKSIERIVSMYKSVATRELRYYGRIGKIWTKGFDKRFCFTQDDLSRKIAYIRNHKLPTMLSPVARNGGN